MYGFVCGIIVAGVLFAGLAFRIGGLGVAAQRRDAQELRAQLERARAAGRRAGTVAERSWRRTRIDARTLERIAGEAATARAIVDEYERGDRAFERVERELSGGLDDFERSTSGIREGLGELGALVDSLPSIGENPALE